MRIALLTYSTKPRGGVVHTLALAEALAQRGHEVDVWTLSRGGDQAFFRPVNPAVGLRLVPFADRPAEPGQPEETVGERIVRSIEVLGRGFAEAGRASGGGDAAGYDIVHAQDCISANAVPLCLRTIHHLDTFTTPELAACHERAIVRPVGHLCVSAAVAGDVRRGWGIEPTVIANGIEADRFAAAAEGGAGSAVAAWRAELGDYVLSVGGIEPRKGTADLIEAMALVQRHNPALRLVIAGGETLFDYREYRAAVERRSVELGVHPIVLGPVDHDRLPSLMAAARVFAFPSTKEGFGMAAMEAMAASTPVVMRDLPVLREVFGDTARFATDPASFAEELLAATDAVSDADGLDAVAMSERQARGRALAARHTWAAAAEQHEQFYARYVDRFRAAGGR